MSDKTQLSTQRPSVFEELARTDLAWWKSVIGRLGDPVTARIVVQYLDGHPELRAKRSGVYLAAAEAVQRDRIRYAKAFRRGRAIGAFVRWTLGAAPAVMQLVARSCEQGRAAHVAASPIDADRLVFPAIVDPFVGRASALR